MAVKVDIKQEWHGSEIKVQGKKATGKSIWEIGLIVEGQAKELAARRYGYLAASINTQSTRQSTELGSPSKYAKENIPINHKVESFKKIQKPNIDSEVLVGTAVDYGPYVEFGTVKMNSQPFLRPALDLTMGKVLTILWDGMKYYLGDYLLRGGK